MFLGNSDCERYSFLPTKSDNILTELTTIRYNILAKPDLFVDRSAEPSRQVNILAELDIHYNRLAEPNRQVNRLAEPN